MLKSWCKHCCITWSLFKQCWVVAGMWQVLLYHLKLTRAVLCCWKTDESTLNSLGAYSSCTELLQNIYNPWCITYNLFKQCWVVVGMKQVLLYHLELARAALCCSNCIVLLENRWKHFTFTWSLLELYWVAAEHILALLHYLELVQVMLIYCRDEASIIVSLGACLSCIALLENRYKHFCIYWSFFKQWWIIELRQVLMHHLELAWALLSCWRANASSA